MSEENVDLVRRVFDAFDRGDQEEALSYADPEAELHSAVIGGAEGKVYRGHQDLRRWYAETFESFEELRFEWSEFRDLGNRVLAFGRIKLRGRESGVELDSATGWIATVRHGKMLKAEGFLSKAEALEAAGLRE
ncbi:MAG TPA: nuclear transport factor 2 family protein [Solirubrobacterales bacterium]